MQSHGGRKRRLPHDLALGSVSSTSGYLFHRYFVAAGDRNVRRVDRVWRRPAAPDYRRKLRVRRHQQASHGQDWIYQPYVARDASD